MQKPWHEVISALKERGKRALGSVLQTSKLSPLDDKNVCLAFDNEASVKIASEPSNITLVEGLLSEKTGRQVKIKITLAEASDADDSCSATVVDEVLHTIETMSAEHDFPFEIIDE
jgi:glycine cleavage system regulatory protein